MPCIGGFPKPKRSKNSLLKDELALNQLTGSENMPLWQIDIYPADGQIDREATRTAEEIAELGLGDQSLGRLRSKFSRTGRLCNRRSQPP